MKWNLLNIVLYCETGTFCRWIDGNVSMYMIAPLKFHVSYKVDIFPHLILYFVFKLLRPQKSCNSWVQDKRGCKVWQVGARVIACRFLDFFNSTDFIKTTHLSIFDSKFQTHSLSLHFTNRTIIPTSSSKNWHFWKHCCVRCCKQWFCSFHLFFYVNQLFLLATWIAKKTYKNTLWIPYKNN